MRPLIVFNNNCSSILNSDPHTFITSVSTADSCNHHYDILVQRKRYEVSTNKFVMSAESKLIINKLIHDL